MKLSKIYALNKNKIIASTYEKIMSQYDTKQYGTVKIVPPKTGKDLVNEAVNLHHCVDSYMEKVTEGKSLILFVREDENKSFLTAEIKNHRINQLRGVNNHTDMVQPKHRRALRNYIKEVRV